MHIGTLGDVPDRATIRTVSFSGVDVVDAAADEHEGRWYVLTADGTVHRLAGAGSGDAAADLDPLIAPVVRVPLTDEPFTDELWRQPVRHHLHIAAHARFVAVMNDFRRRGQVVDVGDGGRVVLEVDGGDYHADTVPLSFTFLSRPGGHVVAVHRTAWNRLDAIDLVDGRALAERPEPQYRRPSERTGIDLHYLDYFHGRLLLSPSGRRLLDDGWVWQPMGLPVVIDVDAWLSRDPWATEDGDGRVVVRCREDWSRSSCWVDDHVVALGDVEDDDGRAAPWVRLFDVDADPLTPLLGRAAPDALELFSDGQHLAYVTSDATAVAPLRDGDGDAASAVVYDGFVPTRQCRRTGELVQVERHALRIGRVLEPTHPGR